MFAQIQRIFNQLLAFLLNSEGGKKKFTFLLFNFFPTFYGTLFLLSCCTFRLLFVKSIQVHGKNGSGFGGQINYRRKDKHEHYNRENQHSSRCLENHFKSSILEDTNYLTMGVQKNSYHCPMNYEQCLIVINKEAMLLLNGLR